jgi:hypothetical protein
MELWGEITLLATGHTNNAESETPLGTTNSTVLAVLRGTQGARHWIRLLASTSPVLASVDTWILHKNNNI